jgi:EF hand domain-containing protein
MRILWILTAAGLVALAGGRAWAQTSGTSANSDSSSQSNSGPNRNREGGDRERRGGPGGGRGGGRDRGGRGGENGNRDSSSSSSGSSTAAKTPPTPAAPELSDADKARAWAKEIIKKNDKNGDGLLQESEQGSLGQSVKADANGDHVITMDELVAFASRKPGTSSSGAASPAPVPAAESKVAAADGAAASDHSNKFVKTSTHSATDSKSAAGKSKSYRFKTAKERLPAGLPGWFTSKDANGDGQVEMSEYSHSWTESTAAEFKRYDLDNDGIITAEEALKK